MLVLQIHTFTVYDKTGVSCLKKMENIWTRKTTKVECYIVTTSPTSVRNAILFQIDNILSWYKIVKHRLLDSYHEGDEIRMK